ncbi:hypothetical protein BBJ28_00009209 [Nothophytophthora sp. Chile5]|nr:hypothetical protein BBJ28_00009209 [Nothophytophthora sp. Chile5]
MATVRSCSTLLLLVALAAALYSGATATQNAADVSFLDFSVDDLHGREVSMREFKAFPVILVVNVASACGYTDQNYRELQVHTWLPSVVAQGFTVLAFPCNQFGHQEPGTPEEIFQFATEQYHVTFPLFAKIANCCCCCRFGGAQVDVNGENAHPLFTFLQKRLSGFITDGIKWNFSKFLIVNHEPLKRYGSSTSPFEIENDILQALQISQHVDAFDDGGAGTGDHGDDHDEL